MSRNPSDETYRDIDYSPEGRGMVKCKQSHGDCWIDESKISYVFAHIHAIAADAFYYFDDRLDIYHSINKFYNNWIGSSLVPQRTLIRLYHYDDGNLIKPHLNEIVGTGEKCDQYANILRKMYNKQWMCSSLSQAGEINQFHKLYQKHMYPDLLTLTNL